MKFATLIAGLLLLAAPSSADVLSLYSGGALAFDYDEFPFGSLSGTFHAEGDLLDLTTFPPPGAGAARSSRRLS
jgi:hypothetical protein